MATAIRLMLGLTRILIDSVRASFLLTFIADPPALLSEHHPGAFNCKTVSGSRCRGPFFRPHFAPNYNGGFTPCVPVHFIHFN